jgi:hypothetical protein
MLRVGTLVVLAVFLAAAVPIPKERPLQPPIPSAGELISQNQSPATNDAQKASEDQRGTDKTPFVIKIQNSQKSQREADQDPEYQERKAADERIAHLMWLGIIVGALQTVALFVTFMVIAFVATRQLRAYVLIEIARVDPIAGHRIPVAHVKIKNFGQTPARKLRANIRVEFGDYPPLPETDLKISLGDSSRPLAPNDTFSLEKLYTRALDPSEVSAVIANRKAIFVIGKITYDDIFHCPHTTTIYLFSNGCTGEGRTAAYKGGNNMT